MLRPRRSPDQGVTVQIDTGFDFRTDARGRDPDAYSPTLRRYHRQLWSKPLPSGKLFDLTDATPGAYLHHSSSLGRFSLASDSVVPTFRRWKSMKPIIDEVSTAELDEFQALGHTIGRFREFSGFGDKGPIRQGGSRWRF